MQPEDLAANVEPFLERLVRLEEDSTEGLLTKSKYDTEMHAIRSGISALLERDTKPELVYRRGIERQPNWIEQSIGTFADRQHLERIQGMIAVVRDLLASIQPDFLAIHDRKKKHSIIVPGDTTRAALILMNILKRAKTTIAIVDEYLDESILTYLSSLPQPLAVRLLAEKPTPLLSKLVAKLQPGYPNVELRLSTGFHDRFVILDGDEVWHFGASLKDLGKEVSLIGQMDGTERQQLLDFFNTHWAPAQVI